MIDNEIIPKTGERVEVASKYIGKVDCLLDIGCGNGILSHFIQYKVKNIYGIDNSNVDLKKAKKRGMKVKNIDLDSQNFPFENNIFDVVTCLDVIEHIKNPIFFLKQIYRVLKKRGILIISTPNIRFSNHLVTLILGGHFPKTSLDPNFYDGGHIHFFTFKDLEDLLKTARFKIIKKKGIINKEKRGWKGRVLEIILGKKIMMEFRSPGILMIARK